MFAATKISPAPFGHRRNGVVEAARGPFPCDKTVPGRLCASRPPERRSRASQGELKVAQGWRPRDRRNFGTLAARSALVHLILRGQQCRTITRLPLLARCKYLFWMVFLVETAMRVAGATLLVIGFLLCVSVAWAAIGFLAMGFGLIFLLIAEERKKAAALRLENSEIEPMPMGPPQSIAAPVSTPHDDIRQEAALREMNKWSSLVASDEDLSRVVKILASFGQKYVDQLARVYVVFDNKSCLPTILNMIIATARKDAGLSAAEDQAADDSNVIRIGRSAANGLRTNRIREFPSAATTDASSANERGIDRPSLPEGASDERSEKNAADEGVTGATVTPSATQSVFREEPFEEVDNIRDLLGRLDFSSSKRQ